MGKVGVVCWKEKVALHYTRAYGLNLKVDVVLTVYFSSFLVFLAFLM